MENHRHQLLVAATALYLVIPALIFAYGWLRSPFEIISLLLIVIFIAVSLRDIYRLVGKAGLRLALKVNGRLSRSFILLCLAFVLIGLWFLFSGSGGFGYQNYDHKVNNALLRDLIIQPWPLTAFLHGVSTPIVYYLGYYLPIAVIGKLLGWKIANLFAFLWTYIGIVLSFIWFLKLGRIKIENRVSRALGLVLMFCLAGGLDYVGFYLVRGNAFYIANHIEFWAGYFQYSSNTTLIYWVPQHTVAAWLMTGMVVDSLYESYNLRYLGMVLATGILTSPFGVFGNVPFLVIVFIRYLFSKDRRTLFTRTSLIFNVASIWVAIMHLLYLTSNQLAFPQGWIWTFVNDRLSLIRTLIYFWILEFMLLTCLVLVFIWLGIRLSQPVSKESAIPKWQNRFLLLKRQFDIDPPLFCLFLISLVVLILLPLYKMGQIDNLVMRGSIPSLFIFWIFVTKVVIDANIWIKLRLNFLYVLIIMTILLGFFPAISEISRSILHYHFGPPDISSVPMTSKLDKRDKLQRTGSMDSVFFRYIAK